MEPLLGMRMLKSLNFLRLRKGSDILEEMGRVWETAGRDHEKLVLKNQLKRVNAEKYI